jgi:hypothetical protein
LEEIESCLKSLANIKDAVVVSVKDKSGFQSLIAFIITETPVSYQSIIAQLKLQLSDYMIPSSIKSLKAFPLTLNNKVDRKALMNGDFDEKEEKSANPFFYLSSWKKTLAPSLIHTPRNLTVILFSGRNDFSRKIKRHLSFLGVNFDCR